MTSISVIMPAYNASKTISRSLLALQAQTHADWRVFVVDDGSEDDTSALVQRFAKQDPRIIYLRQDRQGVSAARNKALRMIDGAWVHFLDSDDVITPDFYARMLQEAEASRASLVVCFSARTDHRGRITFAATQPLSSPDGRAELAAKPWFPIHAAIVQSSYVQQAGEFDCNLKTCEDWDYWIKIVAQKPVCANVPEVMAFYYNSERSLSKNTVQMLSDALTVMERQKQGYYGEEFKAFALSGEQTQYSQTWMFLWSSALAAARGEDITDLLKSKVRLKYSPEALASYKEALYEGLCIGSCRQSEEIFEVWPKAQTIIEKALTLLDQTAPEMRLKDALLHDLIYRIYCVGVLHKPILCAPSLFLRFFHLFGASPLPEDVDRLFLQAKIGRKCIKVPGVPVFKGQGRLSLIKIVFREFLIAVYLKLQERIEGTADRPGRQIFLRALRKFLRVTVGRKRLCEHSSQISQFYRNTVSHRLLRTKVDDQQLSEDTGRYRQHHPLQSDTWENIFETEDPWDYTNPYETQKYQQTLELLKELKVTRGLELACAEGHFTRLVADHVPDLHATDISQTALERAARRCSDKPNVRFRQLDFMSETIAGPYDLIICSEVLYYSTGPAHLKEILQHIEQALTNGGYLVCAHARLLADTPHETGFDWDNPYGAETIKESILLLGSLALAKSIVTPLYRIDLFQKGSFARNDRVTLKRDFGVPLPHHVAQSVVWNGALASRKGACQIERSAHLPVLMYHRISSKGPEALAPYRVDPVSFERQLRFLRRRGYYSLDPRQLKGLSECYGRPVMLTFDDATLDFYETAWPILQRNGFEALVFVPTDYVGQSAAWDSAYGPPTPLMSWAQIEELSRQGVHFGSHLASHRRATELGTEELLEEALRSRTTLEDRLGGPILDVAPPYGAAGFRENRILQLGGYELIFSAGPYALATPARPYIARLLPDGRQDLFAFWELFGRNIEQPEEFELQDDTFKAYF